MRGERKNTNQGETIAQYVPTSECFGSVFSPKMFFSSFCFGFDYFSLNKLTFCPDNLCLVINFFFSVLFSQLIRASVALQELGNILTALLTNTKDQSEH